MAKPNANKVQIADIDGVPVMARVDTETARAIARNLNMTLDLARLGFPVHSVIVWPDTSLVTVSGSECHDPAFEPTAHSYKVPVA